MPLLLAISSFPEETFYGENVYTISQVTNSKPLDIQLAYDLRSEDWVDVVSPEVYAFCMVKGEPVVVRGVDPDEFLEMEDASLVKGTTGEDFLIAGEALGNRLDMSIGENIVLTGSTRPKISELQLTGVFRSDGPSNDELLVPLSQGWIISPASKNTVVSIRVKTQHYDTLRSYLNDTGFPLVLGDGRDSVVLNSNERFDARVATLIFLNPELGGQRGIAHTSAFVQQAGNSVSLVVLAFIVLNSSLILLGIIAVLAKAIIEKKKDIGILSAIGATKGRIRAILLIDLVKISLLSGFVGLAVGFLVANLVGSAGLLLIFGHSVQPISGMDLAVGMLILGLALTIILGLVIHEFVGRERPMALISKLEAIKTKERNLEEVLAE